MKRWLAFVFCGAAMIGLALFVHARSEPSSPLLSDSGRGVIFSASLAGKFANQCSRDSPKGEWVRSAPSQEEITALEATLPGWMKTVPLIQWQKNFDAYHYQYGALVRDGQRMIYINAVPTSYNENESDCEREPIVVCDGGPDFWGVEWNPKTGKFQNVSFNGQI